MTIHRAARIDAIPWGDLQVIGGSAGDLRGWVHGLFEPDFGTALRAARNLGAAICEEGICVFDSTTAALPFVLEALHETQGELRDVLDTHVCEIASAVAPRVDPWGALRALPGSDRLLWRMAEWRDDQRDAADIRPILFEALPGLLDVWIANEGRRDTMAALGVARRLAAAPEPYAPAIADLLVATLPRATRPLRLRLVQKLVEIGAADRLAEPEDRLERWLWLAADPLRVMRLADILATGVSLADIVDFEAALPGQGFFVELGAPVVLARPDLQPVVARALVAHLQRKAAGSDSAYGPSVGAAHLLLVFPGATFPARLEGHQLDLLELAYRCAFRPHGASDGNLTSLLRSLRAPWQRPEASTFLATHGRRPLP